MRYWWVNQNQTYRHEVAGGYLWSPKRNANGRRNPFYDFMREVAPGDVIFSFADTWIKAIGIVASHAYEAPKPLEFGQAGAYWDNIGWRVDVRFTELHLPIRPAERMDVLAPLLPKRYSPLLPNGNGLQSIYLTWLPETLAGALVDLIGTEAHNLLRGHRVRRSSHCSRRSDWWNGKSMSWLNCERTLRVTDTVRAGHRPRTAGPGPFQGARNADRAFLSHHRSRSGGAFTGEPLQAVARFNEPRTAGRRERSATDTECRSSLRSRLHWL